MEAELPDLRTIDLSGPIVYREWEGPAATTFVLVHGLGGSHVNWVQVAPGLAGLGRVLAPDLPGFGRSPRSGRGTRLMDSRRSLARFVEELVGGPVVLVGNSMGGLVSILEAAVQPELVSGAVLTSAVFPLVRGVMPHPIVVGAFTMYDLEWLGTRLVEGRRRAMSPEAFVAWGLRLLTVDPGRIPPQVVRMQVDLLRETRDDPDMPRSFIEAARSINAYLRDPTVSARAIRGVRCPVLVIHGRRDRFVPAALAEAALAAHPTWRGRILPGIGHIPQMEAPGRWLTEVADWFAAELR